MKLENINYHNRMRYFLLIGFCFFALAQDAISQSNLEDRLMALWDKSGGDIAVEAWKWPKEERLMIAKEFKAYLKAGKFGEPEGGGAEQILVELGDREATKEQVRIMTSGKDYGIMLGASGSPIAIEYLAPHAFSDEPYSESGDDVITAPLSFLVTARIFEILSDSSAFTGEVTSWARREKSPGYVSQRAEFQRWWEENKVHFINEDYKAVKRGRPIPSYLDEIRSKANLPSRNKTGLEDPAPAVTRPGAKPTTPAPVAAPIAQAPVATVAEKTPVWPLLAGSAALAVGALLLWKRRASPPQRKETVVTE